jgi:GTP cyclohydrolase II
MALLPRRAAAAAFARYNRVIPTQLQKIAEADFPTRFGHFRILGFREGVAKAASIGDSSAASSNEEAVVLKMGDITTAEPVLVRIHSQCLTGDVFHSLRCDCRAQLELAIESIAREGRGLLIYEQQEGRGIGLLNKLRAYELQDHGADTVEANEQLGFEADLRGYHMPAAILNFLGVKQVRLMSNNPEKIEALERAGIQVSERIPCIPDPNGSSEKYLETKRVKMGHLLG